MGCENLHLVKEVLVRLAAVAKCRLRLLRFLRYHSFRIRPLSFEKCDLADPGSEQAPKLPSRHD